MAGTQGKYEKNNKRKHKCKGNKVLRTTAKMIHELLPNMIKVIKILRARRMIRLPPERYDLNRPLVTIGYNWIQLVSQWNRQIRFFTLQTPSWRWSIWKGFLRMSCLWICDSLWMSLTVSFQWALRIGRPLTSWALATLMSVPNKFRSLKDRLEWLMDFSSSLVKRQKLRLHRRAGYCTGQNATKVQECDVLARKHLTKYQSS